MSDWREKPQVKKGDIGEEIVERHLCDKGYVVYRPTDGPHPFDRLCAQKDKRRIFVAEIKAKAQRTLYPDTGFNYSNFVDYTHIAMTHSMDVYVFFVDEIAGKIYGGELFSRLAIDREIIHNGRVLLYPRKEGKIIYFPIAAMETIAELPREECARLAALTTGRNGNGQGALF